jgi:hypothetical protein
MTTYRVVAGSQFKAPEKSTRCIVEKNRAGLNLPRFSGLAELHQSVIALPEKRPDAVEQFDLYAAEKVTLNNEAFSFNSNQQGPAAKQLIDALGENNPLALLIAHDVMSQHYITFSGTQCLRDLSLEGDQLNFSIKEIAINSHADGVSVTIKSSANKLTELTDDGVGTKLKADDGETLCDVETTYRFTEQKNSSDAKHQYGLEEGAEKFVKLEIVSHNVTVNHDGLYDYNNLLKRYRATANPKAGALSRCCSCICSSPTAPEEFAVEPAAAETVVNQPS